MSSLSSLENKKNKKNELNDDEIFSIKEEMEEETKQDEEEQNILVQKLPPPPGEMKQPQFSDLDIEILGRFYQNENIEEITKLFKKLLLNNNPANEEEEETKENQQPSPIFNKTENQPNITLEKYIDRLVRYINIWAEDIPSSNSIGISCATLSLAYLSTISVDHKNIHRLLLASFFVAYKYIEDSKISSSFWARVGGCSKEELVDMEIEFCKVLNWNLALNMIEEE